MANYVYKYYNDKTLLYVGKTKKSPLSRFYSHVHANKAFEAVNRVELFNCKNAADMDILEMMLISSLKPPLNTTYTDVGSFSFNIPKVAFESCTFDEFQNKFLKAAKKKYTTGHHPRLGTGGKKKAYTFNLDKGLMDEVAAICEEEQRTLSSVAELGIRLYIKHLKEEKSNGKNNSSI